MNQLVKIFENPPTFAKVIIKHQLASFFWDTVDENIWEPDSLSFVFIIAEKSVKLMNVDIKSSLKICGAVKHLGAVPLPHTLVPPRPCDVGGVAGWWRRANRGHVEQSGAKWEARASR